MFLIERPMMDSESATSSAKMAIDSTVGPLYPDIASRDLDDEAVKMDIINMSDASWAFRFPFPSR